MPNLGVVRVDDDAFVLADIPGLIEGAHEGLGLGTRFLRHVSRTAVLVHLVDLAADTDPLAAYDAVNGELTAFDAELGAKPQIVAGTKLDVTEARERFPAAREAFAARGIELLGISAVSGDGVSVLLRRIADEVRRVRAAAREAGAADRDDATIRGAGADSESRPPAGGATHPDPHA